MCKSKRQMILGAIHDNLPEYRELPDLSDARFPENDLLVEFSKQVKLNAGEIAHPDFFELLAAKKNYKILSFYPHFEGTITNHAPRDAAEWNDLDVTVIEADFGVAENGAVWINEYKCPVRIAPFITEHLVVVMNANHIVPTMHEAYRNTSLAEQTFGVFIAGPSKTADIEQSLVIGAQGPRRYTVVIAGE